MNLAKLPSWPRLLRHSLAAAYVGMSSAELDRAVACGEMPDPLQTAVIALLEMECSVAEVSSMSGQSLQLVEHYARARNQTALATAAVLKWERVK